MVPSCQPLDEPQQPNKVTTHFFCELLNDYWTESVPQMMEICYIGPWVTS